MKKSRRLTTLAEFAADKHLRPEEQAGFRAWLHGTKCASDDEWEDLLTRYRTRSLGK